MYRFSDYFDSLFDFYDYLFDGFDKYLNEYLLNRIMPPIITLQEKLSVIDAWLNGESRNDIAKKHNIGSSTVYNIVQKWSNDFGDAQQADRLRELAIKLNKNGLTVSDCAKGLRLLRMLKKYGIQDDEENQEKVPYFLKEIYATCQEVGLKPQQVFDYISDIIKFSSEIPISEIPQFMKKRIEEKEKLESEIRELSRKKDELTERKEVIEQEIQELRNIIETMSKTFKTFTMVRFQLKKYGIEMDDIYQFVKCVVGISKENYNPVQVLTKIADYETIEKKANQYREEVNLLQAESETLKQDIKDQKNDLSYLKIKVNFLDELEGKGFGINEFRTLYYMLNEIGLENNVEYDVIIKQFFDDVKNYEEVIGSRKEIDRLKNERKRLEDQTLKEREKCNSYPKIIESINRFTGAGITEDDIVKIDRILLMNYYYLYKDNSMYKEDLFNDLHKYGNLKLAIKKLEDREEDLRNIKKTQDKTTKKTPNNMFKSKRKESVK